MRVASWLPKYSKPFKVKHCIGYGCKNWTADRYCVVCLRRISKGDGKPKEPQE